MKIGVHMSMFCRKWEDEVTPYLEPLKAAGYDGVEISLYGANKEVLKKVGKVLKELELEVNCGVGITPETDISSKVPAVRENGILFLKECIDKTAEMGSKCLNGVLCSPWREFSHGNTRRERWKRSAGSMNIIGEYAGQYGIDLNVEVLNRFESDFINTLDEGTSFLKMVDAPNVRLLADTFHMNIEEDDIVSAVERNINNIGYIHCCENHRGVPGTGHILWNRFFRVLRNNDYDGWLTLESFVLSQNEVGNTLSIWRDMGEDPLVEAVKGFNYLDSLRNNR